MICSDEVDEFEETVMFINMIAPNLKKNNIWNTEVCLGQTYDIFCGVCNKHFVNVDVFKY